MSVLDESLENLVPRLPDFPYPGLRPFEKSEWPIFVGREKMSSEVANLLLARRLVFVHGPSGSGKSSLVRAGVQASLEQRYARSDLGWRTCAMQPGTSPIRNLAEALFAVATDKSANTFLRILRALNHGGKALGSLTDTMGLTGTDRLCILIDQFEELFRAAHEFERCRCGVADRLSQRLCGRGASALRACHDAVRIPGGVFKVRPPC